MGELMRNDEIGIRKAYEKMLEALERWLNEPVAYELKLANAEAEYRRRLESVLDLESRAELER